MPIATKQIDWNIEGYCDGLLGRDCQAPDNWRDAPKYLAGFLEGQAKRKEFKITLTYERTEA